MRSPPSARQPALHSDTSSSGSKSLAPERLQLVLELGRRITAHLDLQTLLPSACRLIADAFDYDLVGINLLDPLDATRLYQAAAYPIERALPRSFRVPLSSGLTGWVASHGRPRLSNDVHRQPLYVPGPGRQTRSELDIPLKIGSRTIGVLNIESERRNAFTRADIPYLEGLAGQLAQAIENARLAAHARQLAASEERARVARDLHDETAQALVAIGRQLDLLLLDLEQPEKAESRIEAIHHVVDVTLEGVRRLSRNLRPAVLEDLGLVPALHALAEELSQLGLQVHINVQGGGDNQRVAPEVAYAVFRVAQEALNNVAKHAGVAEANVDLVWSPEELVLSVSDRGSGLGPGRADAHGLLNMRDRANEIGADLSIASRPGEGTTVRIWVPLALTLLEAAT